MPARTAKMDIENGIVNVDGMTLNNHCKKHVVKRGVANVQVRGGAILNDRRLNKVYVLFTYMFLRNMSVL